MRILASLHRKEASVINLFTLFATIALDTNDFNKGIDAASSKGETFASKMSNFAASAGKAIAVGLGAAATAFTGLAVKSLQLGGELEQNMGGSEAVFKQFASTVQEKAVGAFETMGLSASDFMATANKMGALMQGSGLDIETSMDMSTQAMQRAADVASIMGIDIGSAMESIAGAAKGNFTKRKNLVKKNCVNAYKAGYAA